MDCVIYSLGEVQGTNGEQLRDDFRVLILCSAAVLAATVLPRASVDAQLTCRHDFVHLYLQLLWKEVVFVPLLHIPVFRGYTQLLHSTTREDSKPRKGYRFYLPAISRLSTPETSDRCWLFIFYPY